MAVVPSPHHADVPRRPGSAASLPPPVPPKTIDLNSSTRSTDKETGTKVTRRAFHCDVIVEREGAETRELLMHLGRPVLPLSTLPKPQVPFPPSQLAVTTNEQKTRDVLGESSTWTVSKQEEASKRLAMLIEELLRTERSYVSRIRALRDKYAEPLRRYARNPDHLLIPLYEAKTIFANIDAIVPAAETFLADLELMWTTGRAPEQVADICLRHLKELRTFEPYRAYLGKQDESQKMLQDCLRRFTGLETYIERIKYQTTGIGNIGLRELLMEPVQRIPRYTLLWQTMLKCLPPLSPHSAKLLACVEIASSIARCEPDAQTVRATVMYCLERNVDGFPANLFSNSRDFVDSIDVDDLPLEYMSTASPGSRLSHRPLSVTSTSTSASIPSLSSLGSSASNSALTTSPQKESSAHALHCTLFLFDDKLMIIKRQSNSISGRKVTGLDDVPKLVKSGGGVAVLDKNGTRKDKLSYKGIVDVLDVIASDVGNGDFHLFFERPPMDQTDRWSARPFRSYTTVHPPFAASLDVIASRRDKLRFIQNLWAAQALARTKRLPKEISAPPRVVMTDEEISLDDAGEPFGRAKCFWTIWDRATWSAVPKKAKVAILIDEDGGSSDPPVSEEGAPCVVFRLQPLSGSLCRFSHATLAETSTERTLIDMADVNAKIATIIHRHGVFKFRTSGASCPTTPSSTGHRLRPSMLNLDMISRNLFGSSTVSSRVGSELFGTTSTQAKRRSGISRTSTMNTGKESLETRSPSSGEMPKMSRQSSSPSSTGNLSEDELISGMPYAASRGHLGQSEIDLNERLNIARRNSKSVAVLSPIRSGRLAARSVAELRTTVREREFAVAEGKSAGKSTEDLRIWDEQRSLPAPAEAALREILRAGSPPLPPSAPLRVRNKSPSPIRPSSQQVGSPIPVQIMAHTSLPARQQPRTSESDSVQSDQPVMEAQEIIVTSPQQVDSLTTITAPLSPRPQGPRSPMTKATPILYPGLGSTHTKLRIVSGGGRRMSAGRETIPLKGDENESPTLRTPSGNLATKRQHSEDQLTPRKRSPTRSPLETKPSDAVRIMGTPLRITSSSQASSRRSSGQRTPLRSSGPLTTPRRISLGQTSITSVQTNTTEVTAEVPISAHSDFETAITSIREKLVESRAASKRLRSDMHSLRRQLNKESSAKGRAAAVGLDRNPSLPRSPQKRNIHRLTDFDGYENFSVQSRHHSGKHEIDAIVMEESARGISSMLERLDGNLKATLAEVEQAINLAERKVSNGRDRSSEIERLEAQVARSKDTQELMSQQLHDLQTELDVTYEAFNTELDGMFNDAQLPPTQAFQALQRDLQDVTAKRNDLALENIRLKRDLEEANLKREQWAKILRRQGVI
ncbi:hypothetical protein BCR39DRAFT_533070 [Naematelia encephala]|uniref:DH domain-containing protein n=1 Tax=Naematelia encephala TaxID=71784 RepID=A0A1Y2B2V8_9TREE|nr:hypothetical protein BCR39DRAFT_533070 [Naematelia encephala]